MANAEENTGTYRGTEGGMAKPIKTPVKIAVPSRSVALFLRRFKDPSTTTAESIDAPTVNNTDQPKR